MHRSGRLCRMQIVSFGLTDVGQKRKHNEDYFLVDPDFGLYIVCDGMGGHASGEVASSTAATSIHEEVREAKDALAALDQGLTELAEKLLRGALERASARIFQMGIDQPTKKGMGTTCSVLILRAGKGVMAHVGDSRIYLVRGGQAHQLSEDHTFLQEAVRHGIMTPQQAKESSHQNIITRAVGPLEKVMVDTLVFDVLDDDTYMLCSDGLHGYLDESDDLASMLAGPDLEAMPQRLIDLANERGGDDNITAVVLRARRVNTEQVETDRATLVNACIDTFRHIQLFQELSMPELLRVTTACRTETFQPNEEIIREGEMSESLFLLVSGQVSVERSESVVALLGSGAHFGEMALLSQRPRSATVKARTQATVMVLDRPPFFAMMQQDSLLATKFLWRLAQSLSLRLDDFYGLQEASSASGSSAIHAKSTLRFGLYPSPFNYAPPPRTEPEAAQD